MDLREKLIEILRKPIFPHELVDPIEAVADYLLDNGVTVQRWIPISERKPDFELVEAKANDLDLYACLCAKVITGRKNHVVTVKAWYDGERFMDSDCIDITYDVTHWMPLPQPPKGE